ncbi:MAG: hypothetical protein PHX18_03400 [Candidatus Gastranaerophilales bacterium]|nr:hypothetical protein [Candidatus Gastranaerophilales bacterium]
MTRKDELEAKVSLEKLDELVEDILTNGVAGGDPNFRSIVFSGLSKTKNPILLYKMEKTLFDKKAKDLKKTIIVGIFLQQEFFQPILEYGEFMLSNCGNLDVNCEHSESLLLVIDTLLVLNDRGRLAEFDTAFEMLLILEGMSNESTVLGSKIRQRIQHIDMNALKKKYEKF